MYKKVSNPFTVLLNAGKAVSTSYLGDANPATPGVNLTSVSFAGFKVNE